VNALRSLYAEVSSSGTLTAAPPPEDATIMESRSSTSKSVQAPSENTPKAPNRRNLEILLYFMRKKNLNGLEKETLDTLFCECKNYSPNLKFSQNTQ
jgi:hypothetical protein